jgi:ER membrane protein complex subunit 2
VYLRRRITVILSDKPQTTNKLLTILPQASRQSKSDSGLPLPDLKTVERLNETATAKLSEIVRWSASGEYEGYDPAEVIAAKALLDSGAAKNIR